MELLHIGCAAKRKALTTFGFKSEYGSEIRLDVDASFSPDVTVTMTDMWPVLLGSLDAIFSSHNVEHLYPHEAPVALAEFLRVLSDNGFAMITCADLKLFCVLVAQDKLTESAYTSQARPITYRYLV